MEEDTGKSLHVGGATGRIHGADYSLVDYNRAGIPLIEIVTKPIMGAREKAPAVARAYVAHLRELLLGLGVSDVRMEQGSLRCDVNLSLAPAGDRRRSAPAPRPRTSTRCARSSAPPATRSAARRRSSRRRLDPAGDPALARGHRRHHLGPREVRRRGLPLLPRARPRARRADAASGSRSSSGTLPEPPRERRARLQADWGFSDLEMRDTVGAGALDLVEETIAAGASPQSARKWWLSELARRANEAGVELADLPITPADVARIQALVDEGSINDKLARQVFDGVLAGEGTPDEVVAARGLAIVSDEGALGDAVDRAIEANPDVADKIRDGKVAAAGALIGAVMKEMRGQADAGRVRELILEKLS